MSPTAPAWRQRPTRRGPLTEAKDRTCANPLHGDRLAGAHRCHRLRVGACHPPNRLVAASRWLARGARPHLFEADQPIVVVAISLAYAAGLLLTIFLADQAGLTGV